VRPLGLGMSFQRHGEVGDPVALGHAGVGLQDPLRRVQGAPEEDRLPITRREPEGDQGERRARPVQIAERDPSQPELEPEERFRQRPRIPEDRADPGIVLRRQHQAYAVSAEDEGEFEAAEEVRQRHDRQGARGVDVAVAPLADCSGGALDVGDVHDPVRGDGERTGGAEGVLGAFVLRRPRVEVERGSGVGRRHAPKIRSASCLGKTLLPS